MALRELIVEMEQMLGKQNYEEDFNFGVLGEHRYFSVFMETFLQHQGYDVVKINLEDVDLLHLFRPDLKVVKGDNQPSIYEQQEQHQMIFIADRLRESLEQCQNLAKPILLFNNVHRVFNPSETQIAQWLDDGQTFNITQQDGKDIKVPVILASHSDFQHATRQGFIEGYNPYVESHHIKNNSCLAKLFQADFNATRRRNEQLNEEHMAREQENSGYQWAV